MQDSLKLIQKITTDANRIIVDKELQVKLSIATFFAGGHILIEDR